MFKDKTYANIMASMLNNENLSDIDKREGSLLYTALAPAAAELAQAYVMLDRYLDLTFADTSSGEYLERRADEMGISKHPASPTKIKARLLPQSDEWIGKRLGIGNLVFKVTSSENDYYHLDCTVDGKIGNSIAGLNPPDMFPIDDMQKFTSAEFINIIAPGEDAENDEELRKRYFNTVRHPAFGGNISDYENKVNSVPGVGGCKVFPRFNQPETADVRIFVLDSEYEPADGDLVDIIQNLLYPPDNNTIKSAGYGLAPIGHIVTVNAADESEIGVRIPVKMPAGVTMDDVKNDAAEAIEKYFTELRKQWCYDTFENFTAVRVAFLQNYVLDALRRHGIVNLKDVIISTNFKGEYIESNDTIELRNESVPVLANEITNSEEGGECILIWQIKT